MPDVPEKPTGDECGRAADLVDQLMKPAGHYAVDKYCGLCNQEWPCDSDIFSRLERLTLEPADGIMVEPIPIEDVRSLLYMLRAREAELAEVKAERTLLDLKLSDAVQTVEDRDAKLTAAVNDAVEARERADEAEAELAEARNVCMGYKDTLEHKEMELAEVREAIKALVDQICTMIECVAPNEEGARHIREIREAATAYLNQTGEGE